MRTSAHENTTAAAPFLDVSGARWAVSWVLLFAIPALSAGSPPPQDGSEAVLDEIRQILDAGGLALADDQAAVLDGLLNATADGGPVITERLGQGAEDVLSPEQMSLIRQAEAGRLLLTSGVEGLQDVLAAASSPPLTFNQETQVRVVYEDHVRVLDELRNAGDVSDSEVRGIEEQLLLAALKFLNPAQRTALTGSVAADSFADLNSDLPQDEAELIEYLGDLRSPAGTEGEQDPAASTGGDGNQSGSGNTTADASSQSAAAGIVIDGFTGGRMPNRDEIQEIRINENSFTAEQSAQTRGRTEIITRGGAGRFNGDATFSFADHRMDARNAIAKFRPQYQQRNLTANLSGPVIRNRVTATFTVRRDTFEDGDTLQAITPSGLVNDAVVRPNWTREYTTRATAQLSENNVLNVSYTWGNVRAVNQTSDPDFGLPEQFFTRTGTNSNFQIKETAVLSTRLNNEVRFRVNETVQEREPVSFEPHINVLGAFRAGGSIENVDYISRTYEFGNLLMYTGNRVALRMGYDGNLRRIVADAQSNFNGTFIFSSLDDFVAGRPVQYSINQGESKSDLFELHSAVFIQSDWRARPDLTLYFGVRYEWQGSLDDSNNVDPRLGFAYSLGPTTVLRGGSGIFHQRLDARAVYYLGRFDGTRQQTFIVRNPSYPDPFAGGAEGDPRNSRVLSRADDLAAPYTWNSELSIETTFSGGLVLTGAYRLVRGVHLFRSRNVNSPYDVTAPFPQACRPGQSPLTCVRPDPTRGNVNQLESTGNSANHNFRIGFRQRLRVLNLNGSYNFNSNYDDLPAGDEGFSGIQAFSLPADNFDLASEWGRSGARHVFNMAFNVRFPWDLNANTILNWSSGEPYTLTTGRDDNQDTSTNDRPPGVPRNSLTGPGFRELGLNLSKAIQLRSDTVEPAPGAGGPVASGGYYGQRTGLRMTVSANVTNLLNGANYQTISGVQTSRLFGLPTRARQPRRMTLSVRFDF